MKHALVLFAMAAALAIAPAALADSTVWSQEICEGGGGFCGTFNGSFNNIEVFIETPGVTFSDAGLVVASDAWGAEDVGTSWGSTLVNDQYVQFITATGNQTDALSFILDFASALDVPLVLDLYATEGGSVVDSGQLTYDGTGSGDPQSSTGWTGAYLDPADIANENTAPEPSSSLLLGTGLLGLAFVAFQKAKSSV